MWHGCPGQLAMAATLATVSFPSLGIPVGESVGRLPVNYEEAREIFNMAMRYFKAAAEYYLLDGFVTEHVNIMHDVSVLYKDLAAFEPDPNRQLAIHLKRAKPLEIVLPQLNPQIFGHLCKQMGHELGEVFRTAADIAVDHKHRPAKVCDYASKAAAHYEA
eukprot:7822958-Pyramimonas_sp.AAC.1